MTTNQVAMAGAIVAVLLTIVSPAVAALPPASAGSFDPLFANEGQVLHQYGNNYGYEYGYGYGHECGDG